MVESVVWCATILGIMNSLTHMPSYEESEKLKVGDYITLLSSGVRSKKGDKARVTGTKGTTVKFVVVRNGHSTHRKRPAMMPPI